MSIRFSNTTMILLAASAISFLHAARAAEEPKVTIVDGDPIVATAGPFYVATNGNDAWSGRLDSPNADKTDGPFATLALVRCVQ